ncbi:DUF4397 domain-containing protein [Pseudoflavitalea sp. G-6-1-2]|uniref:DUF4397 domain-containing protein n=1 Tax=Pseudoflavitalea sp. G-6-1-2 TaxID=2728841 RepID=UPI00146AED66|nr:DUF4397 domain-containing protein [Pseudoflavitalea sp. G-6-1-2]NML23869.1 DUF4397 domain-containing protein [Pseudoflavitalea sp. G-6-1-2]
MILIKRSLFICAAVFAVAACKKDVSPLPDEPQSPGGELSYVNASEDLIRQIRSSSNIAFTSFVLVDSKDTTYGRKIRTVLNVFPFFNQEYQLQFPTDLANHKLDVPWMRYAPYTVGEHEITLMDTAHHPILTRKVTTATNSPATVYFSDALGSYNALVLKDTLVSQPGKVGLRIVNMCPDADLTFTINDMKVNSFPAMMKYGEYSSLVHINSAAADTFKIKVYRADDPENIIARNTLITGTGHGYTVLITGYAQDQLYKAPYLDQWVTVNANPRIKFFTNY